MMTFAILFRNSVLAIERTGITSTNYCKRGRVVEEKAESKTLDYQS